MNGLSGFAEAPPRAGLAPAPEAPLPKLAYEAPVPLSEPADGASPVDGVVDGVVVSVLGVGEGVGDGVGEGVGDGVGDGAGDGDGTTVAGAGQVLGAPGPGYAGPMIT
jgi:hypothetical protein